MGAAKRGYVRGTALSALVALAWAAVPVWAQGLTLKYNLSPGSKASYSFSCSTRAKLDVEKGLTTAAAEMSLQMKVATEVLEAAASGAAKVQGQILSGSLKVKAEGEQETIPVENVVVNYQMTPRGVVKQKELLAGQPPILPGVGAVFEPEDGFLIGGLGLLPDHPVKPGDKWKGVARLPSVLSEETVAISYESKLLGQERYKGRPCAKIRTTGKREFSQAMDAPDGSGQVVVNGVITADTTWRFDHQRGVIMWSESSDTLVLAVQGRGEGDTSTAKISSVLKTRSVLTELHGERIPAK
jgi:hypothetical protein